MLTVKWRRHWTTIGSDTSGLWASVSPHRVRERRAQGGVDAPDGNRAPARGLQIGDQPGDVSLTQPLQRDRAERGPGHSDMSPCVTACNLIAQ